MKQKKGISIVQVIIGIVVVICIACIAIILTVNNKEENQTPEEETKGTVQQLEDGTKLNTSEALENVKTVEGLEISNIQVTEKNGVSVILADVVNNTEEEKGGFMIDITFKDTKGNIIETVPGYIKKLKAGEKTQLNTSGTVDFVETYDVTITKAK